MNPRQASSAHRGAFLEEDPPSEGYFAPFGALTPHLEHLLVLRVEEQLYAINQEVYKSIYFGTVNYGRSHLRAGWRVEDRSYDAYA